MITYEDVF
jgi:hypothetical protein